MRQEYQTNLNQANLKGLINTLTHTYWIKTEYFDPQHKTLTFDQFSNDLNHWLASLYLPLTSVVRKNNNLVSPLLYEKLLEPLHGWKNENVIWGNHHSSNLEPAFLLTSLQRKDISPFQKLQFCLTECVKYLDNVKDYFTLSNINIDSLEWMQKTETELQWWRKHIPHFYNTPSISTSIPFFPCLSFFIYWSISLAFHVRMYLDNLWFFLFTFQKNK